MKDFESGRERGVIPGSAHLGLLCRYARSSPGQPAIYPGAPLLLNADSYPALEEHAATPRSLLVASLVMPPLARLRRLAAAYVLALEALVQPHIVVDVVEAEGHPAALQADLAPFVVEEFGEGLAAPRAVLRDPGPGEEKICWSPHSISMSLLWMGETNSMSAVLILLPVSSGCLGVSHKAVGRCLLRALHLSSSSFSSIRGVGILMSLLAAEMAHGGMDS